MIRGLSFRNYKLFTERVHVPLRRLTILIGKNGSGKTAVSRVMPLWEELANRASVTGQSFPTDVGSSTYSSSAIGLIHRGAAHGSLSLGFEDDHNFAFEFDMRSWQTLARNIGVIAGARVGSGGLDGLARSSDVELDLSTLEVGAEKTNLWEIAPSSTRAYTQAAFSRLMHVAAIREPPRRVWEVRSNGGAAVDDRGRWAPYALEGHDDLRDRVAAYYAKIFGVTFSIERDVYSFRVLVDGVNISETGHGLQQVLPILTSIALIGSRLTSFVGVLEEPELHLHPAAHVGIGNSIVDAVSENQNCQMLVETHSENLILAVRRAIAERRLREDDVNIVWFEKSNGSFGPRSIEIANDGSISDWPQGVFTEGVEQVKAIMRARHFDR